jgi:hypothetical protein
MKWYHAFWTVLFAIGSGFELVALITRNYAWTLSETVWQFFDVLPGQTIWQWRFLHLLLFAFMAWLTVHFAFRIWR